MYVCLEDMCNLVFEDPTEWDESHGLESRPYERLTGCPACYGAFTRTLRCDICGEYISGEFIKIKLGDIVCENCYTVNHVIDLR
jgi:hypothetical protein